MKPTPSTVPRPRDSTVLALTGARGHRVLGVALYSLMAGMPVVFVGQLADGSAWPELATSAAVGVWMAGLVVLHRRGHDAAALAGLVVAMIAAGAAFGVSFGSVRSVGTLALVGAIVCGGIFLGRTALLATLAASVTIIGALIAAQNAGWLRTPDYAVGPGQWLEYTVAMAIIAANIWFARSLAFGAMVRAVDGEAWVASMLRNAPGALIVSSLDDWRIRDVNAAGERMFRVRREQVVGRSGGELGMWVDAGERMHYLERLRSDGRAADVPVRMRRSDGEPFDARLSGERVEIGGQQWAVTAVADVSAEVRAQAALLASEVRFRRLFHESPVPASIFTLDEGRFVDCNAAFVTLFGHARDAVIGRRGPDLAIWCDPADRAAAFDALRRDGAVRDRHAQLRRGDGSSLHALFNWTPIELDGRRCVLTQVIDVSEQYRAEQALRELTGELERRVAERTRELTASNAALADARDAAEAATRSKSQFLANMSHEIRTPMNAVIGLTELALRRPEAGEGVLGEHLRNIRRAAGSLLAIINQVLDFSKIEAQQLQLEHEPFDLDDLMASVRAVLGAAAAARALDLTVAVAPDLPRRRRGDRVRIEQVLLNLGGNAVKFTERGGVWVEVTAGAAPSAVRFTVRDTGIGIDAALLPRLFRPFDQLDASTTRRYGGTGLGLAISGQLAQAMGGRIDVSSTPGVGSSFAFELPLQLASRAAPMPSASPTAAAALLRGRRILLAEDNELNQIVAREILESDAGAVVTVVGNGADALAALEREPFALVLMDVQMPGMDGYEATQRIRRNPRLAALPVVAMTAHAQPSDRERSLRAGMNGHVTKPFEPVELIETLAALLAAAPAAGPAPPGAPGDEPGAAAAAPSAAVPPAAGVATAQGSPSAAAPVLDPALGLQRCAGSPQLYASVLRRFAQCCGDDEARLRGALAQADLAAAVRIAHDFVSTAATVGASALAEAARALQPPASPTPQRLEHLLQCLVEARAAVDVALRTTRPVAPDVAAPAGQGGQPS